MVKFDEFLSSRLEKYHTDPRLLSYVVFLDLQEAWRDYQSTKEYRFVHHGRFVCQRLLHLDRSMLEMEPHCLMLQMLDLEGFAPKSIEFDDQTLARDART